MDAEGRTGLMYESHGLSRVGGIFAAGNKEVSRK